MLCGRNLLNDCATATANGASNRGNRHRSQTATRAVTHQGGAAGRLNTLNSHTPGNVATLPDTHVISAWTKHWTPTVAVDLIQPSFAILLCKHNCN
eukprot:UN3269